MGTKERREREKEETRQLIMDAARRLFVEQGYEAVSMRKIAEAIEYSPAAVYVHFADKESLIREMVREDFHRLDEEAMRLAMIEDPIERIRQIGHGYVRFGVANPHHYKLMFMTPPPVKITVTEQDRAEFDDPSKSGYALLRQAVRDALAQGRLRPEAGNDAELIAQMCWAAVHGVTSLRIAMEKDPCVEFHDPEGLSALMVETVIRGLVAGGSAGATGPEKSDGAAKRAKSSEATKSPSPVAGTQQRRDQMKGSGGRARGEVDDGATGSTPPSPLRRSVTSSLERSVPPSPSKKKGGL